MTDNKKPHIPEFKNRQEMAEFWDTHDVTDYLHELTPVTVTVAPNLSKPISVRFDATTLSKIQAEAVEKGIGPSSLIRMWTLEHLKSRRQSASTN